MEDNLLSGTKSIACWMSINASKVDRLPDNDDHINRRDEILGWYNKHPALHRGTVIIDDDQQPGALPPDLKERLVLTSSPITSSRFFSAF